MSAAFRLLIFLGALHGLAVGAAAAENGVATGQRLVEANCARCHAIGKTGTSPFAPAPPFRDVALNYTPEELVDGFMEGLAVRHKAMPDWAMTMEQAEAIAAYILSLTPADDSPAAVGHDLMAKNCARCHNIETTGDSPLAKAPPFREVMQRYDASNLEEALAEGIVTGHNEMPEFTFEADQIAAIVTYLSSLRGK
jgi:cytochrome c